MIQRVVSQLKKELHPNHLLPSITAGLIAGILVIIVEISFAALIFSGNLSIHLARGIGFALFGGMVTSGVVAITTSFPGMVALPQDSPAAILGLMATAIAGTLAASQSSSSVFFTILAAIMLTTLLTGTVFLILGSYKLGRLIRYIPYPVVGGFLAGTGWLLVQGGIGVITDVSVRFSQLPILFHPDVWIKWLPGFLFAVLLLFVLRRYNHFLIMPALFFAAIGIFYLLWWVTGHSFAEARTGSWLLGPFPDSGLWQPPAYAELLKIDWMIILQQVGTISSIILISIISLLLNASGLEVTTRQDINLNRELQSSGFANLISGLGGAAPGYPALSISALGYKIGSNSRLVGLITAAMCGVMLFAGASLISFFPKPVLGGLVIFIGLSFLVEWVYDAWFKLSKPEYAIVILILITMATVGVLQGVGLGLVMAVILFVLDYSQINVVKHSLSGVNYQSNFEHPRLYHQILRHKGDWIYILTLQSFIFFGTAHTLLEQVRRRINDTSLPTPRFIVLDFRLVSGVDSSAVMSFIRIKQLAQSRDIELVFTSLSPKIQRHLQTKIFSSADSDTWRIYPDLDRGVEWCEEQIVQTLESVGLKARAKTDRKKTHDTLTGVKFSTLLNFLATDDTPPDDNTLSSSFDIWQLTDYMERQDVEANHYLMRQGDSYQSLYLISCGQITVQTEQEDGRQTRLKTMGAGTVVGELGLYLGTPASASVITDEPCTIYTLSADKVAELEKTDPPAAAALHKFLAQRLSEKLLSATGTLQALLK